MICTCEPADIERGLAAFHDNRPGVQHRSDCPRLNLGTATSLIDQLEVARYSLDAATLRAQRNAKILYVLMALLILSIVVQMLALILDVG